MKGRWESNNNCLVPIYDSQTWNCYFQNRIIMFCLPVHTLHLYICERFIYFQDQSAYSAAGEIVDRSWGYINRSLTHKCGDWDWGWAIPRKGIHKLDFPCCVGHIEKIIWHFICLMLDLQKNVEKCMVFWRFIFVCIYRDIHYTYMCITVSAELSYSLLSK